MFSLQMYRICIFDLCFFRDDTGTVPFFVGNFNLSEEPNGTNERIFFSQPKIHHFLIKCYVVQREELFHDVGNELY